MKPKEPKPVDSDSDSDSTATNLTPPREWRTVGGYLSWRTEPPTEEEIELGKRTLSQLLEAPQEKGKVTLKVTCTCCGQTYYLWRRTESKITREFAERGVCLYCAQFEDGKIARVCRWRPATLVELVTARPYTCSSQEIRRLQEACSRLMGIPIEEGED